MKINKETKALTIQGDLITDIHSFYQQINCLFMHQEDWRIGDSLDALEDLLYGNYGILKLHNGIELIWKNHQSSANALGLELTRNYYLKKIEPGSRFNKPFFKQQLAELEAGRGLTYFDKIVEIIRSHENVQLYLV
ncbi:MAG: ribonuclease inhibitor [Flavobacterium sp.]|nr:MAG: ribonuclease inhibitor [Flavobacterium sp.]